MDYNPRLPSVADMEKRAQQRIPRFAWEYLSGGIGQEQALQRNRSDLEQVQLWPHYLMDVGQVDTSCLLFGHRYALGIGISPVGLANMMWPNSERRLAQAAQQANIPYVLSTMGTTALEEIARIAPDVAWFQLYVPRERAVMEDLIQRVQAAGFKALVVTADIPVGAKRDKELKNGLILPLKMTPKIIGQTLLHPSWLIESMVYGFPSFINLAPYGNLKNVNHLGEFLSRFFMAGVTLERIREIRKLWQGPLIVKGLLCSENLRQCIDNGVDAVVLSNHGGRQLDAAPSSIAALRSMKPELKQKLTILIDSGIRCGLDMVRAKALGAQFSFSGRSFLYAMAAAGADGGRQVIEIFRDEVTRTLQQIGCTQFDQLNDHWLRDR